MPDKIVAVILDGASNPYDYAYNFESAQAYAQDGYIVRAIADDGDYWTMDHAQKLYDSALENFMDCFGADMVPALRNYVK